MAFPSEFLATVVEAGNLCAQQFQGDISLLDRVHKDFSMQPGVQGDTVNIVYPGALTVHENADVPATLQSLTSTKKALALTTQPSVSFKVSDWVGLRANPIAVKDQYTQPALVALANYADAQIASKFTAANFNTYAPIASVTARSLAMAQLRDARIALHGQKVPVDDTPNMTLCLVPEVYDRALGSDDFSKHDVVGPVATEAARRTGVVLPQYAAQVFCDHNLNTTTQMNNVLFHRYAIGAALRPIEIPQGVSTKGSYINYRGIPVRALFDYSITEKAWILSFDFAMGVIVLRPECGVLIYSALT